MNTSRTSMFRRLFLLLPILTIGFWLIAQEDAS